MQIHYLDFKEDNYGTQIPPINAVHLQKTINKLKLFKKEKKELRYWTVGDYNIFRQLLFKPMLEKFDDYVTKYDIMYNEDKSVPHPEKLGGTMISWQDFQKAQGINMVNNEGNLPKEMPRTITEKVYNSFDHWELKKEKDLNENYNKFKDKERKLYYGNIYSNPGTLNTSHISSDCHNSSRHILDSLKHNTNDLVNREDLRNEIKKTAKVIDSIKAYNPRLKAKLKKELEGLNKNMDLKEIDGLYIKRNIVPEKTNMTMGEKIKSSINKAFNLNKEKKQDKKRDNDALPIENRIYTLKDYDDKKNRSNKQENKGRWGDRFICCSKKEDKLTTNQKDQAELWNKMTKENKNSKNPFATVFWKNKLNNMNDKYDEKKAKREEKKEDMRK